MDLGFILVGCVNKLVHNIDVPFEEVCSVGELLFSKSNRKSLTMFLRNFLDIGSTRVVRKTCLSKNCFEELLFLCASALSQSAEQKDFESAEELLLASRYITMNQGTDLKLVRAMAEILSESSIFTEFDFWIRTVQKRTYFHLCEASSSKSETFSCVLELMDLAKIDHDLGEAYLIKLSAINKLEEDHLESLLRRFNEQRPSR